MDDLLTRHDLGPVTRLTLSRPATYNALSLEMIEALIATLARIDDETRVVILAAEGLLCRPRPAADARRWLRTNWRICSTAAPTDADDPRPAPAGHRPGSGCCHRGGLPAGRVLRHGGGGRRRALRGQRGLDRSVLRHADGGPDPRHPAQGRVRDADDRRLHHRHPRGGAGPGQPRRPRRGSGGRDDARRPTASRPSRPR